MRRTFSGPSHCEVIMHRMPSVYSLFGCFSRARYSSADVWRSYLCQWIQQYYWGQLKATNKDCIY